MLIYTMNYSQFYRESFVKGRQSINITENISIETNNRIKSLKIDSYDNPINVHLCIKGDIDNADIEFAGIIIIYPSAINYGHITCKHIAFMTSTCIISKLTVDTIEFYTPLIDIEFDYNDSILGIIGPINTADLKYFPNLIITTNDCDFDDGLLRFYYREEYNDYVLADKTHQYYPAVAYLCDEFKTTMHNKNSVLIPIEISQNSKHARIGSLLIEIVAEIKKYNRPLIKNAYMITS